MRYTLSKRGRTLLLFLSAASYIAWFSGLGERSAAEGMTRATAFLALQRPVPKSANIALAILRDPFDGLRKRATLEAAGATNEGSAAAPNEGSAAATDGSPTVPDISVGSPDAPGSPAARAVQFAVHATITGQNPVAYVEDGTSMDIVRVGDTLGGQRVTAIDLRGLSFASGARLDLPDGYAATPSPHAQGDRAVLLRLGDLRRLFGNSHSTRPQPDVAATTPVITSTATPTASAAATAAATDERPAPLRTADSRGFPVGTNPLPDSGGATPEPYPYPYAPPR